MECGDFGFEVVEVIEIASGTTQEILNFGDLGGELGLEILKIGVFGKVIETVKGRLGSRFEVTGVLLGRGGEIV